MSVTVTDEPDDVLDPTLARLWDEATQQWLLVRVYAPGVPPGVCPHEYTVAVPDARPRPRLRAAASGVPDAVPRADCARVFRCTGGVQYARPLTLAGGRGWVELPHRCTLVETPRSPELQARMDALDAHTRREAERVEHEAGERRRRDAYDSWRTRITRDLLDEGYDIVRRVPPR